MENEKEVNNQEPSFDEKIDAALDAAEQTQEDSPENAQTDKTDENVTDTVKTDESPEASEETNKTPGMVPYERLQEVVRKNQEAQRKLDELEQKLKLVDARLGDPSLSKKDLLSLIAEKKGWDLATVDKAQLAQLKDLVGLAEIVADIKAEQLITQRFGPVEGTIKEIQMRNQTNKQIEDGKVFAQKYGLDWDKDITPALKKALDDLDQKDPEGKLPFNMLDWLKDHTLQIISERARLQGRQEERNKVKSTLKPLTPGATGPTKSSPTKVPNFYEDPDGFNSAFEKAFEEVTGH